MGPDDFGRERRPRRAASQDTWDDLRRVSIYLARGAQYADREDIAQYIAMKNVEQSVNRGEFAIPSFAYAKYVAPRLARSAHRRVLKITRDDGWDSWYNVDLESAIDLARTVRERDGRERRAPRGKYDLSGKKFGDFAVRGLAGYDNQGGRKWETRCLICGEEKVNTSANLKKSKGVKCTKIVKEERVMRLADIRKENAR